jgi:hypothetical protein
MGSSKVKFPDPRATTAISATAHGLDFPITCPIFKRRAELLVTQDKTDERSMPRFKNFERTLGRFFALPAFPPLVRPIEILSGRNPSAMTTRATGKLKWFVPYATSKIRPRCLASIIEERIFLFHPTSSSLVIIRRKR